jgi:hypothetical protein
MPAPRRALVLGTLASNGRVHVVEEDLRDRVPVPLGHWPMALDELSDRRRMPGVAPPFPGGLPGPRNHGREQDEGCRAQLPRDQGAGKRAKRLRDDGDIRFIRSRLDDCIGVITGARVLVVKRKGRGQAMVATVAQRFDGRAVDARIRSRAGYQDERGHLPCSASRGLHAVNSFYRAAAVPLREKH